jgi:hypothetical protein
VKLRCRLLSILRLHSPDCQHCNAREEHGVEMRRRLEELNWRTQAHSPNESTGVFDSVHREVISTTISLEQKRKKIA